MHRKFGKFVVFLYVWFFRYISAQTDKTLGQIDIQTRRSQYFAVCILAGDEVGADMAAES